MIANGLQQDVRANKKPQHTNMLWLFVCQVVTLAGKRIKNNVVCMLESTLMVSLAADGPRK